MKLYFPVTQGDVSTLPGKETRQVGSECGFTRAAFWIDNQYGLHHILPPQMIFLEE